MKWLLAAALALCLISAAFADGAGLLLRGKGVPPTNIVAAAVEVPGPSAALFNSPYYSCGTNYYVATNGLDSRTLVQAQSPSTPWLTIQHANDAIPNPSPNTCINVAAGTYATGVSMTKGGNAAASTGYLVYRCATLDGCIITDGGNAVSTPNSGAPNYIIWDGFKLQSSAFNIFSVGYGLSASGGTTTTNHGHHYWILNSIVTGYGQGGFQGIQTDFVYLVHNTFNDNAQNSGCDGGAQGSGISMVWPAKLAGYTLTNDDKSNPITGSLATRGDWFRAVYSWNIVALNHMVGCGVGGSTDGNGIIMDTFDGSGGGPGVYDAQTLIAFNVGYNNGAKCVHVFSTGTSTNNGVTVANNSCYNNNIDTDNTGTARPELSQDGGSSHDLYLNNIAFPLRAASGVLSNNNTYVGNTSGTVFDHNMGWWVSVANAGEAMFNGATWTNGQEKVNPLWVNVGNTSSGDMDTAPNGVNFALQAGSPAIGIGLTPVPAYLQDPLQSGQQALDLGACYHTLAACP